MDAASAQVPPRGTINLDHLAHFVPDIDAAGAALDALGFTLTPFSPQSHRLTPDGPLVPAGTGNRCVMLERGYLEFLTPTGATPIADQLRIAIARYVGVHLIAFGTSEPERDHARLAREGFSPGEPVALQRPIGTPDGEDIARFTVVRVAPGTMAEGRIQFCQQHTPHLLWQPRWTRHRNGARALASVLLCVADPDEAAARYSRYTGLAFEKRGRVRHLRSARGTLTILDPATLAQALGVSAPAVPWIAGYALEVDSLDAARAVLGDGAALLDVDAKRFALVMPPALGGILVVQRPDSGPLPFE